MGLMKFLGLKIFDVLYYRQLAPTEGWPWVVLCCCMFLSVEQKVYLPSCQDVNS